MKMYKALLDSLNSSKTNDTIIAILKKDLKGT
jgi:hypothetical protein